MPTPVTTARQCLTDEAARALDDAVTVARRRSHAQTTSLHAVSALLSLPSAALRDACARCHSSSYSPRLQFRALELSVGVSLDRLPTTKTSSSSADEAPPVSNSLMAAIKRSQANQRRHPNNYHLMQMMQQQQQTTSLLKVELKHFILSILDDPIVSRVFGEAGLRSYHIKLALLQPPPLSRIFSRLTPPVFLCNLDPVQPGSRLDDNCRRIVQVVTGKTKRNPLLMGAYAKIALKSFIQVVTNAKGGVLPIELNSLSVVSLEKEIGDFLREGGKVFEDVGRLVVEKCSAGGAGLVVCFGDIEVFVAGNEDSVGYVVSQLTSLLGVHGRKVWLVGVVGTSEAYSKFLRLFPTVDKDWDLHLLTMTSATPSMEGLYPKSSLMGSFVPFGGFFSTPSEFKNPVSSAIASSLIRCDTCNEKYEEEVADMLKVDPAISATGYSTSLPWLQKVNVDTDRGLDVAKTNAENTSLNTKICGLQRKWSDICQRLHQNRSLPEFDITKTRFQAHSHERFQFGPGSSNKGPFHNEIQYSNQNSYLSKESRSTFPFKHILPVSGPPFDTVNIIDEADHISKFSKSDVQSIWVSPSPKANTSLLDHTSSPSFTPVTTDLGLGTIYTSAAHEPDTPKLSDHKKPLHHLSDSLSTDFDAINENTSHHIARSSSCSGPNPEGKFETVDFKSLYHLLNEKVGWQDEAIYAITQTVSRYRSGVGKRSGSHVRADIWLAFLGPDRLGKRKLASALAEILFGNRQSLITVDLSSQDRYYPSNSIFEFQSSHCHDVLMRKTVGDYIAGELSRKPNSVVFLENVDQADFLVQNSLFQVIRTGKFPYSHGREISINNAMFIFTSSVLKGSDSFILEGEPKMFTEERILEAKRCQMRLSLGHASDDAKRSSCRNVKVAQRKRTSKTTFSNKRKLIESGDSEEKASCNTRKQVKEASRSYLDLNMPLEEVEESSNSNDYESESIGEKCEPWLSDLCDQVDEKVVFKPFNFDSLAEQVIKRISIQFQKMCGAEFMLEIEYEVMEQILAAAWLSDKKKPVEDWVEHVLGRSFAEAQQKYHFAPEFVMKLVNCERIFFEEHSLGLCLPSRINLN